MPEASETELRRTMIAVVFGGLMSMLDTTIVNIAIRTLSVHLHTGLSSVQWVVTGYLLALAAALPLAGWLADRFGPRRMYVGSIAFFTLMSVACGFSSSIGTLIGFRVLQGVAGALTAPVGQIILVRIAGPSRMARVMGTMSIPIIMAPVFAPVIGGLLVEHLGWQWVFFVNLPVGLVAVPLSLWLLPRDPAASPSPAAASRSVAASPSPAAAPRAALPEIYGFFLISFGSVAVTYGLASVGSSTLRVWLPTGVGIVLLAAFVLRSARLARPLLDVRLYRNPAYSASSMVNFALGAAIFGAMILLPLYYQTVRHQDPVMTGLLAAPTGIGAALATRLAARLTDRIGSGQTALIGGLAGSIGTVPFLFLGSSTPYLWLMAVGLVRGTGISLCLIPAMTAIYRAVPPTSVGDATTQLSVLNRLGGSTGTAIFTVVLTHSLASGAGAAAYGSAFRWALGASALAIAAAAFLIRAESRQRAAATTEPKIPVSR